MSQLTLTRIRLKNGLWEGRVSGAAVKPDLRVTLMDRPVEGVTLIEAGQPEEWELAVPVPTEAIADGVQTFLISDASSNAVLGHFTLIAGDAMVDDLRAEVALLRAELDMLKRAFRRHCVETA